MTSRIGQEPPMDDSGRIRIRRAETDDAAEILTLLADTLGWSDSGIERDFFRWKHHESPFGASPSWVAVDGERIVGYRTFLNWQFLDAQGRTWRAVRAVDTVTAPDYRGRGIFRALTLRGIADLTLDGIGWVFNTPNDSSRPGYLSMGWRESGRVPIGVLPRSPRSVATMLRARTPAHLSSEPCDVGLRATHALQDADIVGGLLTHTPRDGVRTARSQEYLAWRMSFEPLRYRVLLVDDRDPGRGGLVFRLRRRGDAVEATIVEALVSSHVDRHRLLSRVLRETGADYAIATRAPGRSGLLPLPRQGPRLTVRALASAPPDHAHWRLALADIELF